MSLESSSADASPGWYVVSQVKSERVVYFTDDPNYRPAMEGDWYFVSHHRGPLPDGMTLRNCWGWRFNGNAFAHARDPDERSTARALVDANRQALHTLLQARIDAMRRPWAPSCQLGETLRAAKLAEARAFLAAPIAATADADAYPLLDGIAAARRLTLREAAQLVQHRDETTRGALVASERLRESFAVAIDAALTNDDLVALRVRLIDDLAAAGAPALPAPPLPMTPEQWDQPVAEMERAHETASLRAQLRDAINARRRRVHDGYIDNDPLMKHKAKLAQAVLNNDGIAPADTDVTLLANFAAPRHLRLEDAARLVLGTVTEAESILRVSEREKDRLLARIDAASTLREFHRLREEIGAVA